MDVLVLNRNFFAIQVVTWRRALRLVYLDHAEVVDEDYRTYNFANWCQLSNIMHSHSAGFVHTPRIRIAIPEVIALKFYDRIPFKEIKFTRKNIYEHYNYRCCYCGKKYRSTELNLDHVIPRSRGGKTDWNNVVTSCISCNLKKGGSLPEEKNMKLVIKPTKPDIKTSLSIIFRPPVKIKSSWQKFIDNVYWNIELEQE